MEVTYAWRVGRGLRTMGTIYGRGVGWGAVVSCKTVVGSSTLPRVHGTQCMRFLVDSNRRSILDKLYYVPGTFCKMSYEFGSY